jgi:hypothetical protein
MSVVPKAASKVAMSGWNSVGWTAERKAALRAAKSVVTRVDVSVATTVGLWADRTAEKRAAH